MWVAPGLGWAPGKEGGEGESLPHGWCKAKSPAKYKVGQRAEVEEERGGTFEAFAVTPTYFPLGGTEGGRDVGSQLRRKEILMDVMQGRREMIGY